MNTLRLEGLYLNGSTVDVEISGGKFSAITPSAKPPSGLAIVPPFYNAHTHHAMTLLRGKADDLELFTWLNRHIWPLEAKLSEEMVYHGVRLAILEMIHSGTVFFNDMYWYERAAVRAAEEMGVRACVGRLQLSSANETLQSHLNGDWLLEYARSPHSPLVEISLAPHAIYTVAEKTLAQTAALAAELDMPIHIHLAETKKEVDDCLAEHGKTPFAYLDSLGVLGPRTICAHSVHMTDEDRAIAASRGCVLVHCPASNMKLASGVFDYSAAKAAGCRVALGTDGTASNNNLSMFDEMKLAALLAKVSSGDPTAFPAEDVYRAATLGGAEAFGINAGEIAVGREADCLLLRLDTPFLTPNYNFVSNLVYAADSSCVDTVICRGRVLMSGGKVGGEEEIIESARRAANDLLK